MGDVVEPYYGSLGSADLKKKSQVTKRYVTEWREITSESFCR